MTKTRAWAGVLALLASACGSGGGSGPGDPGGPGNPGPGPQPEAVDFRTLANLCLNVAEPDVEAHLQIEDRDHPEAQFSFLLERSFADNPPPSGSTFAADGGILLKVNELTPQGDYAVLITSESGAANVLTIKVVDDPDFEPFPLEERPFLLGMTPSVGRYSLGFHDGNAVQTLSPGLVSFWSALGSSDLILLQVLPEWGEPPYEELENFLKPTIANIRRAGRDVLISLDTFGSRFRDQIAGHHLESLREPCGGNLRFSCPLVRERFARYAEAIATEIAPGFMVLGVEADLYYFWNPGDEYSVHFAEAFKEAAARVKEASPKTKTLVSVQYDGGILMFASLLSQFVPDASAEQAIEERLRDVFEPLAPECDLLGITTFPELIRNFRVAMDDTKGPHTWLPVTPFYDPAEIPEDYYGHVARLVGTEGMPPRMAVTESGWSTLDVDTFTCEDYAHYPLSTADTTIFRDGETDPAVTFRTPDGQRRALRRMVDLMADQVDPEFWIWFYNFDPSGGNADLGGAPPIFPIFQSMGFHEDVWEFDGVCDAAAPDTPENAARVRITGTRSKAAYCDWLRLFGLPYAEAD